MNVDSFPVSTVKVVVAGPFAAGKTTFIQNISQTPVVQTEQTTLADEASRKSSTTVSIDYGTYTLSDPESGDIELLLFGTPGQERFRFMIDVAAIGMDGFILVVDAQDTSSHAEAGEILDLLRSRGRHAHLVAVNKTDDIAEAAAVAEGIRPGLGSLARPVDVRNAASTATILIDLLMEAADQLLTGAQA